MRDLLLALFLCMFFALLPARLYAPLREGGAVLRESFSLPPLRTPPAPAFPETPLEGTPPAPSGPRIATGPDSGTSIAPPAPKTESATQELAAPKPRGGRLRPRSARLFAGPGDLSPEDFAAYGVIAFNGAPKVAVDASDTEAARHRMICEAFLATLAPRSAQAATSPARIVVTVWPMQSPASAERATQAPSGEACPIALQRYRMPIAHVAISAAVDSGLLNPFRRGPFLMAWQPGAAFASPGKPILFDDLSDVTRAEEARARFARWDSDIGLEENYARALVERMGRIAYTRLQLRAWADGPGAAWLRAQPLPGPAGDGDG